MFREWTRYRFDLVEYCLGLLFVGFCVWQLAQGTRPPFVYADEFTLRQRERLKMAYGPAHYSQFQEEWIIRDFFKDRRGGVFVDVGASHYRDGSTTYYLEGQLGWSGVAVDPQRAFEEAYRKYRPGTRFFPFFVSDVSNQTARLYMLNFETQNVSAHKPPSSFAITTSLDAPTITLSDLLDRVGVKVIDFLSVDVELSEPKVLNGFDIGRFRPTLVCIEAHPEVRQQILDFFGKHSYVLVGRYLSVDTLNLYFTPLSSDR